MTNTETKPGYHLATIVKHPVGTAGKLREELEEFEDALNQGCKLMAVLELSDLIGAIRMWLQTEELGITLEDLVAMSDITKRVFENGMR